MLSFWRPEGAPTLRLPMMMSDPIESFLKALDPFSMELGLGRMHTLLRALGNPERRFRCVQIAGTNGKGSAAVTAAALLQAAGHKAGLYTSPHLVHVSERIRVDGRCVGASVLERSLETVRGAMARAALRPTYFEVLTAAALEIFAREGVEFAVLEVGLGGRLDATSAVAPEAEIITRIGLDHMAVLGPTIEAIAAEKAAIIRPGTAVFVARQRPEARRVIEDKAREVGAKCLLAGRDFGLGKGAGSGEVPCGGDPLLPRNTEADGTADGASSSAGWRYAETSAVPPRRAPWSLDGLELSLRGGHQLDNAEAAVAAARFLSNRVTGAVIRRALASVRWAARFETLAEAPVTILDGAHNPDGAEALCAAYRGHFPGSHPHLVFSALADKDVEAVAGRLFPLAADVWLVQLDNPRALPMARLACLAEARGVPFVCCGSVDEALEGAHRAALAERPQGTVLIAGSLYLAGEVLRRFPASLA